MRSIAVIDWVETQNGMPALAAAFASSISPSNQTRPATAVGAIANGSGRVRPRMFALTERSVTSTSASGDSLIASS